MQNISRLKNVISQEDDLELLHELKNFPVFMGCVDHGSNEDLCADQSWSISSNNGIIQLTKLIPLNILLSLSFILFFSLITIAQTLSL